MKQTLWMAATAAIMMSIPWTAPQAENVFPQQVFVTLRDSGELARFAGGKTWKGDVAMLYNDVTADGRRLVVSSPKKASIYVFDTKTNKRLARVSVGKASKGLKISPNGKEVYVANEGEGSISVVDLKTYKVVATIKTEEMPHNVRFSRDGRTAYVTFQGGAGLGVIDTSTRKVSRVIATPGIPAPHNLDLSKDGNKVYIRDTSNLVGVLNLRTAKVEKVVEVGQGHAGIDVSPDGKLVFTGAIADDVVTVLNAATLKEIARIKVGFGPHGVRADKTNRWLYVAVTSEDKFAVIDIKKLAVVAKHKTVAFPFWVAVAGNP